MLILLLIVLFGGSFFFFANLHPHRTGAITSALFFGLSIFLLVLNMGTHLGLTKTTNNERVYVYNGDQKSPLPGKRGLAKTTRVAGSVTTTNAKHATLTLTTTKYTYQNQLAKVLFAIPGTKLATTQQVAHFTVPKSWLVLSSKQATRLKQAAANPTNQATLKTQATAYVTAHVQSDLKALAAKAQAGDQAAQAQLANQTQLTQSLAAKYQRAFTHQALLKLSSH
ncbi:DUF4811 domain-containing protein [Limosilactobacillus fermentum]|uniref:DUF4811 domain-containing protein n=1 Tax=Limosilactobacillus fermentum TaxID=1613 RepID=UPI0021C1155D|nr:DUF4811 domain-containing protein [Limosilactobacillus fermentum]